MAERNFFECTFSAARRLCLLPATLHELWLAREVLGISKMARRAGAERRGAMHAFASAHNKWRRGKEGLLGLSCASSKSYRRCKTAFLRPADERRSYLRLFLCMGSQFASSSFYFPYQPTIVICEEGRLMVLARTATSSDTRSQRHPAHPGKVIWMEEKYSQSFPWSQISRGKIAFAAVLTSFSS